MTDSQKRLFCFGYGYTSDFLGRGLEAAAPGVWSLAGTTRDSQKKAALRKRGIEAHSFDTEIPLGDPLGYLKGTTHLLISTPPDQDGDLVYRYHAEDLLSIPTLEWVGYLSTTGVYGDRDGGWVDETTEARPSSIRGTRRARAEEQWLSMVRDSNLPMHIFRLAGIYGPGRSALDSVRAGIARRIIKPGHAFSRVHIDDIVQTLMKSFEKPSPGTIYNVADNEAAPSHEVIAYACRLLGQQPPPLVRFEEANLAPITLSFYSENKRIRNDKIKQELGVVLKYPDYRQGLEGCLAIENEVLAQGIEAPWALQTGPDSGSSSF